MNSLCAWTLTPERQLKAVDLTMMSSLLKSNQFVWIHVVADVPKKYCKQIPGLPLHVVNSLGEGESRPRSEVLENGILLNLRYPNALSKNAEEELASFRIWLTEHALVTVQRRSFELTNKVITKLDNLIPPTPIELLSAFLAQMVEELSSLVCTVEEQVDLLEDTINKQQDTDAREQLMQVRRRIIMIRRYLLPQRDALVRLHFEKTPWINDTLQSQFREYAENTTRIVEDLDAMRERTILLQEMLSHATQQEMNRKIYLLSVVAVIFMPLSFMTGLLGINVGGIPGNQAHDGFYLVCAVLAVLALFELWLLRRRKWL